MIGFVFQSFNLIEELGVFENIELPLLYMGVSASELKRRVAEVMTRVDIGHRANKEFRFENGKEVMVLLSELNVESITIVMITHLHHDAGYAK